jgi:serine/threonine protein kinase
MHQTTNMLEVRLEKNRSRKSSAIFTDREMTLSKVYS